MGTVLQDHIRSPFGIGNPSPGSATGKPMTGRHHFPLGIKGDLIKAWILPLQPLSLQTVFRPKV